MVAWVEPEKFRLHVLVHAIKVWRRLKVDQPDILHHSICSIAFKQLETLSFYVVGQENILIVSNFI